MRNTKTSTLVLRLLFVAICVVFVASNIAISAETKECPLPDTCGVDGNGNGVCVLSEETYTCYCPGGTAHCIRQYNLYCPGEELFSLCVGNYACRCD